MTQFYILAPYNMLTNAEKFMMILLIRVSIVPNVVSWNSMIVGYAE